MHQNAWTLARNPYNFVAEDPAADSIRFAAPRLNQYQGQTGVLHCSLKLLTPRFIRGRRIKLNDQDAFDPFEINSKPAIPASSLRGCIRSIYETITQSCYSVFFKAKGFRFYCDIRRNNIILDEL
jgi:hypothetical protein